jgi:hypothetical protein
MALPDIPIFKIAPRGNIFTPTPGDPDSGISEVLAQTLRQPGFRSPVEAGSHRLIPYAATIPHTPEGTHIVYWVDREKGNTPATWKNDSWRKLAEDNEFLSEVERFVNREQAKDPSLRMYFFMGFADGTESIPHERVSRRAMQSQRRQHLHAVSFNFETPHGLLDPIGNDAHKTQLSLLLNAGGEHAIQTFREQLQQVHYGQEFTFVQPLGITRRSYTERTLFGFESLQEALQQSLRLVEHVQGDWTRYLTTLKNETHTFAGLPLPLIQSCVPNMAFFFPSEEDRKQSTESQRFTIWTMPFAVTGFHSAITPGGAVTERG